MLDEFVVIPEFKKQPKIMNKIDKDISILILKEHIQQIYGVLDNSKYLHNIQQQQQSGCFTITSQLSVTTKPITVQQQKSVQRTESKSSQVLELNVASLKTSEKDKKIGFSLFNSFRSTNNERESMLDLEISDDSDSGSISLSAIGSTVDLHMPDQRIGNETSTLNGSLIEASNELLISSEIDQSNEIVTNDENDDNKYEISLKVNNLELCAQLIKKNISVFGRLFHVDICDNNEFIYEKNENTEINFRLTKGSECSRKSYATDMCLEIRLLNEFFSLNQSTLAGLIELVEDEQQSEGGLPIKIIIDNCKVNMSVS
jgi:hypothetical protein